jgi:hypothetical protein
MLSICLWSLSILAAATPSRADVVISFIPTEEAKFLIKGNGLEGIASVTLTVDYDTTYLSAPEVTVMGGKLGEGGLGNAPPGRLNLNILNNEHSSTFEACIFFQKQGDYPAVINFVTAEVTDLGGRLQPAAVAMMANPNTSQLNPVESSEGGAAEDSEPQAAQNGESRI